MKSSFLILKCMGKGKFLFLNFYEILTLSHSLTYVVGIRCTAPYIPLPWLKGLGHWTGTGATQRTEQNLQEFSLQLLGCWAGDFLYGKDCALLILPKKNSSSLILEGGHKSVVHQWAQMPGLGCWRPREGQDFTQPCPAFPGLVDGVWSHPDIANLPHGLYRMLNSVSRDKHIFLQEFSWIMTELDNFAVFAAPNSQTQLYK